MFILTVLFAVIIGYLLGGRLKNLDHIELNGIYIVFFSFILEALLIFLLRGEYLTKGVITLILNLIMYMLLFYFIYLNRKSLFLVLMGFGFLLNAIVIFANGGAMPVSTEAVKAAGLTMNVSKEGLYMLSNESTRLWFLGDVIPFTFITNLAISIGDIISAIALMLFIILSMVKGKNKQAN